MNVYDTANRLAYEIKNSEEYINYKKLKEEVSSNLELKEKLDSFEKARYEIQLMAIQGGEQDTKKARRYAKFICRIVKK